MLCCRDARFTNSRCLGRSYPSAGDIPHVGLQLQTGERGEPLRDVNGNHMPVLDDSGNPVHILSGGLEDSSIGEMSDCVAAGQRVAAPSSTDSLS